MLIFYPRDCQYLWQIRKELWSATIMIRKPHTAVKQREPLTQYPVFSELQRLSWCLKLGLLLKKTPPKHICLYKCKMIEQKIPLWGWCITGKTFEKEEDNNNFTPWNSSIVGRSYAILVFLHLGFWEAKIHSLISKSISLHICLTRKARGFEFKIFHLCS